MSRARVPRWAARILALLGALFLAASCCASPSLPAGFRILGRQPEGAPLSRTVLLLADNQAHHLYGEAYWIRNELVDAAVSVAIRPVQLDLFGQDLLRFTLEQRGQRTPIIHLGDALDLGCEREFDTFFAIMASARHAWVFLPGNHDGYFAGNLGQSPDWPAACARGGGPIDKARFVERYLRALAGRATTAKDAGGESLARALSGDLPATGEWTHPGGERSFVTRLAFRIDHRDPQRSFVAHEVDLGFDAARPARAFLLDTSQYDDPPSFPGSAGRRGDVLADQRAIVRRWFAAPSQAHTVVMGHHPFDQLSSPARALLGELRGPGRPSRRGSALFYVSAHSHEGKVLVRRTGDEAWIEINVGSVVDFPPEYRTLKLLASRESGKVVADTPLGRVAEELAETGERPLDCDAHPDWEAKPDDPDFYLSYKEHPTPSPALTQRRLADTMLAAYARLLAAIPTARSSFWPGGGDSDATVLAAIARARGADVPYGDKADLLVALERFEAARVAANEDDHGRYRLCQALWASKYERSRARAPVVEDRFFELPTE